MFIGTRLLRICHQTKASRSISDRYSPAGAKEGRSTRRVGVRYGVMLRTPSVTSLEVQDSDALELRERHRMREHLLRTKKGLALKIRRFQANQVLEQMHVERFCGAVITRTNHVLVSATAPRPTMRYGDARAGNETRKPVDHGFCTDTSSTNPPRPSDRDILASTPGVDTIVLSIRVSNVSSIASFLTVGSLMILYI